MSRIPRWLVWMLISVSLMAILVGFGLDLLFGEWLAAHPLTSGVIGGTISLPITTLVALFLVDFFVARSEKLRRRPLEHALQRKIARNLRGLIAAFAGLTPATIDYRLLHVGVLRCHYAEYGKWHSDLPTLPSGWLPAPPTSMDTVLRFPEFRRSRRRAPQASHWLEQTLAISTHLDRLADVRDDASLAHFVELYEDVVVPRSEEILAEFANPDKSQTIIPDEHLYADWMCVELLMSLTDFLEKAYEGKRTVPYVDTHRGSKGSVLGDFFAIDVDLRELRRLARSKRE